MWEELQSSLFLWPTSLLEQHICTTAPQLAVGTVAYFAEAHLYSLSFINATLGWGKNLQSLWLASPGRVPFPDNQARLRWLGLSSWTSMPRVDFFFLQEGLGRGREPRIFQSLLSGIEPLKHRHGSGGRMRSANDLPLAGRHHSPQLGKDGALCSWLHLPRVDMQHYKLGGWKRRRKSWSKCPRLPLLLPRLSKTSLINISSSAVFPEDNF